MEALGNGILTDVEVGRHHFNNIAELKLQIRSQFKVGSNDVFVICDHARDNVGIKKCTCKEPFSSSTYDLF